jgi:hypothetical protein
MFCVHYSVSYVVDHGSSNIVIFLTASVFKSLCFRNSMGGPILLLWQLISVDASIPAYLWMLISQEGLSFLCFVFSVLPVDHL